MNWQRNNWAVWLPLLAVLAISSIGCTGGSEGGDDATANIESSDSENSGGGQGDAAPTVANPVNLSGDSPFTPAAPRVPHNPKIVFKTSAGDIHVTLNAEKAPITVDNFMENYVERGFYNDTIFHYVQPDVMIVGGGYGIDNQPKESRSAIQSEADNGLSNKKGTLAMARAPDYQHGATSQFFFNLQDNSQFDHQSRESAQTYGYCVFGEVTQGMDVLAKIGTVATKEQADISPALPVEPVVIHSIEVVE